MEDYIDHEQIKLVTAESVWNRRPEQPIMGTDHEFTLDLMSLTLLSSAYNINY